MIFLNSIKKLFLKNNKSKINSNKSKNYTTHGTITLKGKQF